MNRLSTLFLMPLLTITISHSAWAAVTVQDVQNRISHGTTAIRELMNVPETSIPQDLLRAAKCIASIRLYKAGFIIGGKGGTGVVSCRDESGEWSAPVFINLGGLTWGLQIGVAKVDLTLVFTNADARNGLSRGVNIKLSADAGLTAGPVGRSLSAGTDYRLEDRIYSYSRSVGLYGGLTLEGSDMFLDKNYNAFVYGEKSPSQILTITRGMIPTLVRPYVDELGKY